MSKRQAKEPAAVVEGQNRQPRDVERPKKVQDVPEKRQEDSLPPPALPACFCEMEYATLAARVHQQNEELRNYRDFGVPVVPPAPASDSRQNLGERLDKANLHLKIAQSNNRELQENSEQLKKVNCNLQSALLKQGLVKLEDGTIHDEFPALKSDIASVIEENSRLKAELAERQSQEMSALAAQERQTVVVVDEWMVPLKTYYGACHADICEAKGHTVREFGIHWTFKVRVPISLVQKPGSANTTLSVNGTVVSDKSIFGKMDERNMIWPCEEEQLKWLITSLDNLPKKALEKVRAIDELWMEELEDKPREGRKVKKEEKPVMFNERQLSTLDCAFLARLLVSMKNELRIPTNPPVALPDDFQPYVSLDASSSLCCRVMLCDVEVKKYG